ncbi:hypothetical protein K523DRAFT_38117 [Schizophyllum commune Tattone D]|nr:hypothetical protein K523DRAFT_38117 [Schizophyllum commune Tattone D]
MQTRDTLESIASSGNHLRLHSQSRMRPHWHRPCHAMFTVFSMRLGLFLRLSGCMCPSTDARDPYELLPGRPSYVAATRAPHPMSAWEAVPTTGLETQPARSATCRTTTRRDSPPRLNALLSLRSFVADLLCDYCSTTSANADRRRTLIRNRCGEHYHALTGLITSVEDVYDIRVP